MQLPLPFFGRLKESEMVKYSYDKIAMTAVTAMSLLMGGYSAHAQSGDGKYTVAVQTGSITGAINVRAARFRKNVAVYLDYAEGDFQPPEEHPTIDQRDMVFQPHVLVVTAGTTVDFKNSDNVKHNIFSPSPGAGNMNLGTYGKEQTKPWTFDQIGDVVLLCNVHAEMSAWILVRQNPFFAVTGDDGKFEIKDVPTGRYTLKVWSERLSAEPQEIDVKAGEAVEVSFELRSKRKR